MYQHPFILTPGTWLGQGKIQLNMVSEELAFFTRWTIGTPDSDGRIECFQEIQVKGLADVMHNQFTISGINQGEFQIELENQALGKISGKGIINEKLIAWEFRVEEIGFEGFEFYEKQEDQTYTMRAEYATSDQFRTLIQGSVWKQHQPAKEELA
ncbi:MAG: hypothetical protein K2P51_08155 [Rhabdochlamydiaceae bacterium]|nr:hypothetical protein [Rhabdochlamydiaceae bacterium]